MIDSEARLPLALLRRATLQGNEFAWSSNDIPAVISAAADAGLANLGGQLQFRVPDIATCEAHWVSVFPYRSFEKYRNWDEFVRSSANETRHKYYDLFLRYDFLAELRLGFQKQIEDYEATGDDPRTAVCFVWYVRSHRAFEEIHGRRYRS